MHLTYLSLAELGERVLVATVVFVICTIAIGVIRFSMYDIFALGLLRTQIIETVCRFALILSCVYIVMGETVARTLLGGFSIGLGYALQPLWLGALNILWIKSEHSNILSPQKSVRFGDKVYTVQEVGLFHVKVSNKDETMFISNSKLSENIAVINNTAPSPITTANSQFKFS